MLSGKLLSLFWATWKFEKASALPQEQNKSKSEARKEAMLALDLWW